jgi:energy-coupling factor transporter ATP-binding protein EcfA2
MNVGFAIETRGLDFTYSSGERNDSPRAATFSLRDVNLAIPKGTVNVVIGSSGCGKTTLLRCLTGIIPSIIKGSFTGSVKLNGREIISAGSGLNEKGQTKEDGSLCENHTAIAGSDPQSYQKSFDFQEIPDQTRDDDSVFTQADGSCVPAVRPNEISLTAGLVMQEPDHQICMTTVEDDIAFGPENRMIAPDEIRVAVDACSRTVGLSDRLTDDPATLSGGGKQRLAIAGTLASAPDILLFDEPISGLDESGRAMFAELVQELKGRGKTIVIVEHEYEEFSFADTWILMKGGEVISVASPRETDRGLLEDGLWR